MRTLGLSPINFLIIRIANFRQNVVICLSDLIEFGLLFDMPHSDGSHGCPHVRA